MKKQKFGLKNLVIGGVVGLIVGVIYNFDKTFLIFRTFGNLIFPLFLWILFGLVIGIVLSIPIRKSLKLSLGFGLLSLIVIFNSLTLESYHNIIRITIEKIVMFPFGVFLDSYSYLGWLIVIILIFVEWSLIGLLCNYLLYKFRK